MTIKCKKFHSLSSHEEIKDEQKTLDDKCQLIEIKENESGERGELVEKCVAKKRNVLDLYHIGKTLSLARIERKWEADFAREYLEEVRK